MVQLKIKLTAKLIYVNSFHAIEKFKFKFHMDIFFVAISAFQILHTRNHNMLSHIQKTRDF